MARAGLCPSQQPVGRENTPAPERSENSEINNNKRDQKVSLEEGDGAWKEKEVPETLSLQHHRSKAVKQEVINRDIS